MTKISRHGYKIVNVRPNKEFTYEEKQDLVNTVLTKLYQYKKINRELSINNK